MASAAAKPPSLSDFAAGHRIGICGLTRVRVTLLKCSRFASRFSSFSGELLVLRSERRKAGIIVGSSAANVLLGIFV